MKVNIVGTGCTWTARNNTSFIIDDVILFDVPSGNYRDIIKSIDIFKLNAIFISHWHSDHFGDLHIITTRFIRESRKNGRLHKLKVYGKRGLAEHLIEYNKLTFSGPDEVSLDILYEFVEFIDVEDGFEFEESGYKVKTYKVDHGKVDCYGFTFTDNSGKTIAFTADTRYCENLEKMLSTSNYAFIDVAAAVEFPSHLHVDKFIEVKEKFKKCKMYPIHMTDASKKLLVERNLSNLNDGDVLEI